MPVVDTRGKFFQPVHRRFQRLLKLLAGFLNLWLSTACEPEEPAGAGLADKPEGWRLGVALFLGLGCDALAALACACCLACWLMALQMPSLTNFHKANCSSALAISSNLISYPLRLFTKSLVSGV